MSEVWVRAILIAATVGVVALALMGLRYRSRVAPRTLRATGLEEGVFLMTSSACSECATARDRLDGAIGESGYTELSWERDPEVFESLEVDGVPAVLVIDGDGFGELWPGQPDRVLKTLGP